MGLGPPLLVIAGPPCSFPVKLVLLRKSGSMENDAVPRSASEAVLNDDASIRCRLQRLAKDLASRIWNLICLRSPRDVCDTFGLCDVDTSTQLCGCIDGFSPASPSKWSMRIPPVLAVGTRRWTAAIERAVMQQCSCNLRKNGIEKEEKKYDVQFCSFRPGNKLATGQELLPACTDSTVLT